MSVVYCVRFYGIVLVCNSVIVASKWIIDRIRSVRAVFEVEVELKGNVLAHIQELCDSRDMRNITRKHGDSSVGGSLSEQRR